MSFAVPYCISYQDGQFLTAQTMQTEADYFTNWITLQNRSLYTPGWLMGLRPSIEAGNRLAVEPGTGIDSDGRFLILPETGIYTVQSSRVTNPSYLILRYPTIEEAKAASTRAQALNMAGVLVLISDLPSSLNGIVLARVNLDQNGVITDITDSRVPVTTLIQPQPPVLPGGVGMRVEATLPPVLVPCRGTVDIPREQLSTLKAPGDHAEMIVHYVSPDVPAFAVPPLVVASVRGPQPYAVNIDQIGNVSFVLRVTVFIAAAPPETIVVDWMAINT